MSDSSEMNTVSEVMKKLQEINIRELIFTGSRGFTFDNNVFYQPDGLQIIKVYRFEGISDPSDMSIIYVMETTDGLRGYSLNAYGMYDNKGMDFDNFIRLVPEKGHGEQLQFEL